ncbi:acetyl-coenzyme A synthetase [Methanobrevibacter cuticularis]|uniref:Acetyl-coenzyme A synthetase n=1 Tax=Methanobrevibacter cuticularis TaxID=47311 RepID=A0A166E5T6_9EURY|nr:AMP-binding protein [Methanobrevibacter cuticularis]KZX16311.1 acetyl-coenzyme A synthetase [Methanobrevibacter cuticularis]
MSSLIKEFVNRVDFDSYEDFKNNFKFKVPENFNFAYDVVDRYAKEDPEKIALVWCDDNGEEEQFTFADMKKYSAKTANLFKNLGIGKGDVVMLTLKNRFEFWFSMIAIHKIGAIAIPATHMLKVKDMTYRITKANIKMILSVDESDLIKDFNESEQQLNLNLKKVFVGDKTKNKEIKGWLNFTKEIESLDEEFERPQGNLATSNDDTFLIYFSSGTTGQPKMVEHDFTYPLGHLITAKYWHNVVENGLHHTSADTGWAKSSWGSLYGQWIAGTGLFIYDYDKFDALKLLDKVHKYKVNTFCAPPTIYRFLIKEDLSEYDFSNWTYATTAGEPLNPEVYNKFYEISGLKIREGFGQSETIAIIANFIWIEPKPGSMGKPAPTYNIELLDNEGAIVELGEEGEITVNVEKGSPPGLFREYYKDPKKTKESWYDNHYHSGDTAWKDEDDYLWFIGRTDDIIKSSGYRIGPFEVESALLSHPSVLECAISGYPDDIRGQVVKSTVVLAKGYEPSEELKKELQNHVKNVTAPYKYPRVVEFIEELPKTISGKIKRGEIRDNDKN